MCRNVYAPLQNNFYAFTARTRMTVSVSRRGVTSFEHELACACSATCSSYDATALTPLWQGIERDTWQLLITTRNVYVSTAPKPRKRGIIQLEVRLANCGLGLCFSR